MMRCVTLSTVEKSVPNHCCASSHFPLLKVQFTHTEMNKARRPIKLTSSRLFLFIILHTYIHTYTSCVWATYPAFYFLQWWRLRWKTKVKYIWLAHSRFQFLSVGGATWSLLKRNSDSSSGTHIQELLRQRHRGWFRCTHKQKTTKKWIFGINFGIWACQCVPLVTIWLLLWGETVLFFTV